MQIVVMMLSLTLINSCVTKGGVTCDSRLPEEIAVGGEITFLGEGLPTGAGLTGLVTCDVGLNSELTLRMMAETVLMYKDLARTSRA